MTSTPVSYPLLFTALVSVCLIIHVWWPDPAPSIFPIYSLILALQLGASPTAASEEAARGFQRHRA